MPGTAGIIGKGTALSYCATSGGTYVKLGEVVEAPMPDLSMDSADMTHYESPNATMEEIPGGWTKPGEMPITINYVKGSTNILLGTLYGVLYFYKLTLPDGSVWAGPGFINKLSGAVPNKDAVRQQLTLKQTGQWTFTPAA